MKLIEKKNSNFVFYCLALVIFITFLGFAISGEDGLAQLIHLKKIKVGLLAENRALLEQNLELRLEQKSLYDPETIEYQARKSLGLVYPDEVIYVIED